MQMIQWAIKLIQLNNDIPKIELILNVLDIPWHFQILISISLQTMIFF